MVYGSHKNYLHIHLGQVLKLHKVHVSYIFYHVLFSVELGRRASKMFK